MKIGLVCPYNILGGGGVQECVFALRRELERRGHDALIVTPLPRGHGEAASANTVFIGRAAPVKSFHTTSQLSISVSIDAVDNLLNSQQFDVLHFHEPWVPMLSMQLLSRSRAANVATFHAKLPETVVNRTIERVITPYTKSIMRYVHGLSAVSESAADYVRTLTERPITIIPNGIDLGLYSAAKPSLPRKRRTILYIGRLEKRKGLIYLLKAYELLASRRPDLNLVIAGEGVERNRLETFVHDYQLPNIRFTGYVNQQEKLKLLSRADLFCSPAPYGESFGIVLLEAMASGLVTVAGYNSGYAGVMQDRGRISLVNPRDSGDFSRRLELLLYDEDIRALWRQWALAYVHQFDYARITDSYEALYRDAVKRHASHH